MPRKLLGQVFIANRSIFLSAGAEILKGNRLVPFIVVLALLAFALASLSRSQPGQSILLNSAWLVYLVSLAPLIGLGVSVALIVYLAYNWRLISDALGFGLARKRAASRKKKFRTLQVLAFFAGWFLAIEVLSLRCSNGIICRTTVVSQMTNSTIIDSQSSTPYPLLGSILQVSGFVQLNWLIFAVIGLVVVSSVIVVRSLFVSWEETRSTLVSVTNLPRPEGFEAVEAAINILTTQTSLDPRTRIINCYQSMVQRAEGFGTTVTLDQTARELEVAIRGMIGTGSHGIRELTRLFEEARYSLHPITEDDAERAHQCLLDISHQMDRRLSILKVET